MKRNYWYLGLLLVLLGFGRSLPQAEACSGWGAYTLEELVQEAHVIVKARPVELDTFGHNAVLQVESYLKGGEQAEYILLGRLRSNSVLHRISAPLVSACRDLDEPLIEGETRYWFLYHANEGSWYSVAASGNPENYLYAPNALLQKFYARVSNAPDRLVEIFLTEAEFRAKVAEVSGEFPQPPSHTSLYPRKAALQLTTTSGKTYLVPVDSTQPAEWQPYYTNSFNPPYVLSKTGSFIAYWGPNVSEIELSYNWIAGSSSKILLEGDEATLTTLAGHGAWSQDDRWFAYSDRLGLWRKEMFRSDLNPELLIPTRDNLIPIARYFSPEGRYLAIAIGDQFYTLDTEIGELLPDGIVSSQDRFLLAFNTQEEILAENLEICFLWSTECQAFDAVYEKYTHPKPDLAQIYRLQWRNEYSFFLGRCIADQCQVDEMLLLGNEYWAIHRSTLGNIFAYNEETDNLAVANGQILSIDYQSYNLSSWLEDEIVSLEWLPAYFYNVD